MSARNELRRRVVVLDPMLRSREHMRRAIRALGHAPLVFNDLEELSQLRGKLLRCSALCVGLPPNPGYSNRVNTLGFDNGNGNRSP